MPARVCNTYVSAIPANNGTFKKRFKSQDVYKQFYELVVRLKDCSYEDAGVKLQDRLCHWLAEQGEEEVADWFSAWWCGPVKGRWLLGNGGYGLVANVQGMEANWRWDSNVISGGRQERRLNKRDDGGGEGGGRGRKENAGLAGFSSHLHRQHAQEPQGALQAGLALMGHPNAFPSVPNLKASASDWTIMQSLRVETLRHTIAFKSGKCRTWKMAVDQLTRDAEDMRVLVRNLKEQERRVSPTSHAPVLRMPTQKFMRTMPEIEDALDPTWQFTMRAAQFAYL